MAQRLVRTICPDCKTTFVPDLDELPLDFPLKKGGVEAGRGHRDPAGHGRDDGERQRPPTASSGRGPAAGRAARAAIRGRTGIHELLVTNDVIRTWSCSA